MFRNLFKRKKRFDSSNSSAIGKEVCIDGKVVGYVISYSTCRYVDKNYENIKFDMVSDIKEYRKQFLIRNKNEKEYRKVLKKLSKGGK